LEVGGSNPNFQPQTSNCQTPWHANCCSGVGMPNQVGDERMSNINPIVGVKRPDAGRAITPAGKQGDFAAALSRESARLDSLKISSHAQKRLNSSQVTFSESDVQRLDGAVRLATEKGANQSLIMLDNLALVVSVKNRVVITAVDDGRAREGIFTNIDSVVIA